MAATPATIMMSKARPEMRSIMKLLMICFSTIFLA